MYLLKRSAVVFLCNLPMGATGFGDAIVLYVMLSFFGSTAEAGTSELSEIIYLLTVGGIGSLGIQTWMLWRQINWDLAVWLAVPSVVCCMVAMSLLEHLAEYALDLKHLLGVIFLFSAMFKVRTEVNLTISNADEEHSGVVARNVQLKRPLANSETTFWTVVAACASGALAGLYGAHSPPLMIWVSSFRVPKDEWRAVNAIVWLIVNFFRLFHIVVFQSQYEPKHILEVGSVLAFVGAAGAVVGAESSKWIGEYAFRIFLIVLLIFGANTMLFAGASPWEPFIGILTTFMGIFFYSFYMIFIDRVPSYPSAHRSTLERVMLSAAGLFSTGVSKGKISGDFGSVRYQPVSTSDLDATTGEHDDEIGRV